MLLLLILVIALVPSSLCQAKTKYKTTKQYIGKYKITHYCGCSQCCGKSTGKTASGTKAKAGRTISVDPRVIPYGSKVKIGNKTYVAEDTGGAMRGKKVIDIFCKSHSEALKNGVKYQKVYIIKQQKVKTKKTNAILKLANAIFD